MTKKYSPYDSVLQNGNGNGHTNGQWIRRQVEGKTDNHRNYIEAIATSDITFCEGIAGTGKTFMAVGMAIHALLDDKKSKQIYRLVISRPIVPAGGEDIGFLPGDLHEKTDPYMEPIYGAIRKFCKDDGEFKKVVDRNVSEPLLEVVPLAFMRGRTFDNAFVILDEAQNTTREQMKMFLSRMGKHCKVVITGDLSQSDLDNSVENGLVNALLKLDGKEITMGKVSICYMTAEDQMRNDLITEVLTLLQDPEDEKVKDEEDEDDEEDEEEDEDDDNDDDDEEEDGGPYCGPSVSKQKRDELKKVKIKQTIANRVFGYFATEETETGAK